MPVYRYRSKSIDVAKLNSLLPTHSAVIKNVNPRVLIDIEADAADKADIDEILMKWGYEFVEENPANEESNDIGNFLNTEAIVVDPITGLKGRFLDMQVLDHRRDLYNDPDNPIYNPAATPILGGGGWLAQNAARILNLETIHSKNGWHEQLITGTRYSRPANLLIYYGWLSAFNSGGGNEAVAQKLSQYNLLVFGDGLQNPGHADYANTSAIIARIAQLNPAAKIFGYVATDQLISDFSNKVDQWGDLSVHGVFMDRAGYDYGINRADFNARVDYVHSLDMLCLVNAWNMDHIIGTVNDPAYPNTTWNPGDIESTLTENDWYLLESFCINTTAWTPGYEGKTEWSIRGIKAIGHRKTYGINLAGVGIIDNANVNGQDLFDFGFVSANMWSLEAFGTSDTSYASGSAQVNFWTRPDVSHLGIKWTLDPSIQLDAGDTDVYWRFLNYGKLMLDFSTGAQASAITKW